MVNFTTQAGPSIQSDQNLNIYSDFMPNPPNYSIFDKQFVMT